MIVEDNEKVDSKMDNRFFEANKFAFGLRTNIFQEHFGKFVMDPVSGYEDLRKQAIVFIYIIY